MFMAGGAVGVALLAWRDHAAGPEAAALALGRLTLSSAVWAHVVMLLGGVVFGVVARTLVQRWRQLADERERQFRELLASAADRYLELDAELRFAHPTVDVPSAAGPVPSSFIGRHPWVVPGLMFDPGEARRHEEDLRARRPFEIEVESRADPRRPPQRLAISGRPRHSTQGQFLGYWCAGRDISAQQQQRDATAQAADGRATLACVADEVDAGRHVDVVLLDLQMPGLDGVATTRALRAAGVHTPVVALTATVFDDARAQALAFGFVDVLSKPIDAPLLKALLAGLRRADA